MLAMELKSSEFGPCHPQDVFNFTPVYYHILKIRQKYVKNQIDIIELKLQLQEGRNIRMLVNINI